MGTASVHRESDAVNANAASSSCGWPWQEYDVPRQQGLKRVEPLVSTRVTARTRLSTVTLRAPEPRASSRTSTSLASPLLDSTSNVAAVPAALGGPVTSRRSRQRPLQRGRRLEAVGRAGEVVEAAALVDVAQARPEADRALHGCRPVGRALLVELCGQLVAGREASIELRERRVLPAEHLGDGGGGVQVRRALRRVGLVPGLVDGLDAVALGQSLEEDPVAVVPLSEGVVLVERVARPAELAVLEVLPVVVDVVGVAFLGPRRGGLHEPAVLGGVVGELDRVEELVRRRHLQARQRAARELDEVVVEHAVAGVEEPLAGHLPLGRAEPVEPVTGQLREVDVELCAAAAGAVGRGRAVAEDAGVEVEHGLERVEGRGDLVGDAVGVRVGQGRRVPGRGDVVHAEADAADGRRLGDRPAELLGVGAAVRGPRQQRSRRCAGRGGEARVGDPQVGQRQRRALAVRTAADQGVLGLRDHPRDGAAGRRRTDVAGVGGPGERPRARPSSAPRRGRRRGGVGGAARGPA